MANQTKTYTLNIDGNAAPSMSALRKEARELDKTLATLPAGSAEAAAALRRIADVKDSIGDLRAEIAALAPDAKIKGFLSLGEAAVGAFSVATVAAKEFGLSGGAIEQYQAKLVGLIAVLQSIETFRSALEPEKFAGIKAVFTSITGGLASVRAGFTLTAIQARIASITIRSALVATGVGALVVAIGLLVANFDKLKEVGAKLYQTYKTTFDGIRRVVEDNATVIRGFFAVTTAGVSELGIFAFRKYKEFTAETAAEAAKAQATLERSLRDGQEKIAKSQATFRAAQIAQELAAATRSRQQAEADERTAQARYAFRKDLSDQERRDEVKKLQDLEVIAADARRRESDAEQAAADFRNERFNKLRDEEIKAISDTTERKIAELREAGEREIEELDRQGGDVANLQYQIAARVQREVEKVRADAAKEAADKAKEAAKKVAEDRLEIERNTSKLLIAGITDETDRRLAELDEQAKQEKAAVKGTADEKALQISLIDQNLRRDRAKTQADGDKARLDKARETAQREIEILQQKELALVDIEVQAAQRNLQTDGPQRLFQARLQQLGVQQKAELAQTDLTEEAKLAIKEKYLTLATQLEAEYAETNFQTITQSIQRASQTVAQLVASLVNDAASALDATLAGLDERLSDLDQRLSDTRSRIESDEQALETATGQRRASLIAKIEQEKRAEAALRKERESGAAQQLALQKEQQKLQEKSARINQASVAVETVLATVEMIRTAAKAGQFSGPAAPFVIAATAAAGVAAALSLKNALKFREGGLLDGPSHEQGGIRGRGAFGNVEVEGGEFIVNKRATAAFLPQLRAINDVGRTRYIPASNVRFAGGGVLPTPTMTTQSTSEIVVELQALRAEVQQVRAAVLVAPTLAPKPVIRIGTLEAEAITEQQVSAAQQKALATF